MSIYLLQNFESIDTQLSLGGLYAYPIPYFDNGPATDGLHIGGACHEQGGSHDPSGLCQVQYRRGGCYLRIWTTSAGRQVRDQLRHRRNSNTRLNCSLHSEVQFHLLVKYTSKSEEKSLTYLKKDLLCLLLTITLFKEFICHIK